MGARGPQAKPAGIKLAEGNPGRRPIDIHGGMQPTIEIPDAPAWLCKEATREWKRASVELYALGVISKIDRAKFAIYCQSYGHMVLCEQALAAKQREARKKAKGKGIDSSMAETDPFFQKTPTGFFRESGLVRRLDELRAQVHRYAQSFGMDPSSRSRVQTNEQQLPLAGFESPAANEGESGTPRLRDFA